MSDETVDVGAIMAGMARVEEWNDQFRQPNPRGRYPICKPKLGNAKFCERCGFPIMELRNQPPCPAVPPADRWGEDWSEVQ